MISLYCNALAGDDASSGASPATALRTVAGAFARLRGVLATAADDVELLFYGEAGADIAYNFETGVFWSAADQHPAGKAVRFGAYGSGRPWWTARRRVAGWSADNGSVCRAPLAGDHADLWLEDGTKLVPAQFGRNADYQRVVLWEPGTKSLIVSSYHLPPIAGVDGLVLAIQMGWSISYLRVAAIATVSLPGYSNVSRVTFEPEGDLEFAKAHGGMGALFAYGPYHAVGQRFWWEGRREFLAQARGSWWHDRVNDEVHINLPAHVGSAQVLDAIGVHASNGLSTIFSVGAAIDGTVVRDVLVEDIGIKHVGWAYPAANGYVGYGIGVHFENDGGSIAYASIPFALAIYRCTGVAIRRCHWKDVGPVGLGGFHATKHVIVDGNAFERMAGPSVQFNAVLPPFDDMPPWSWAEHLLFANNIGVDTGWRWTGSCFGIGPWAGARVLNNYVRDCTDDAFYINTGARCVPGWPHDILVMDNDVVRAMTLTTDGGAYYTSGNLNRRRLSAHSPIHPPGPHLRMIRNRARDIRTSGYDPLGGHSAVFYTDLGSEGVVIAQNEAVNADLFWLENCGRYSAVNSNRLVNVVKSEHISYAGFNDARDAGGIDSTTLYEPPLTNPPGPTDIAKFEGTGAWAGRAFRDAIPFPTIAHCFKGATTDYDSLSSRFGNGSAVAVNVALVGPDAATRARFFSLMADG